MHLERPYYVSDLIVYLLHGLGIEYVTLNPGATTRGMHESLVTYGGNTAPEVITCCHEEIAAAMAEGYYLATGRPLATLVHNIVGLQHASKAIYEAWLRERSLEHVGVGVNLDHPATDFAILARSFGLYGEGPITEPEAIRPALERGL